MKHEGVVALTEAERVRCGRMADVLIPEAEGMPSATQVGVHETGIDAALAARPDLLDPFREALALGEPGDPAACIANLHSHGSLFDAFSIVVAGAYLMTPRVRQLIGYPGQEARPVTGDDLPEYIDMLETVVARGSIFRPTLETDHR